jgi:murein DD-endopeptidase MepM/ murein hydrolase activator NlpD
VTGPARRHLAARGSTRTATLLALAIAAALLSPAVARAHSPGTNGWYWPTGTSNTGGGGGWLQYRSWNHSYHLAKDIRGRVGTPVYALADGYVYDAYKRLSGYAPAGAMIVVYKTADGKPFKTLYGHIRNPRYRKGQRVTAGALLAYVAPCGGTPHLHFGIHLGVNKPNDPRRNPFMGHSYVRRRYYGWVDPVDYLKTQYPLGTVFPSPAPTSTAAPTSTVDPAPGPAPAPLP